jgi:hypothetical protein
MKERRFGWHNLHDDMMLFRAALIQFIVEPKINWERAKEEAVSLKHAIEAVIELPEDKKYESR